MIVKDIINLLILLLFIIFCK